MSRDFEHVDPRTLVAWVRNPRVNDVAVGPVARSIERFGFGAPVVARPSDRRVLAGHTRVKAALSLGLETVPVRWLELADGEADAFALADNRLGEIAAWDDLALADLLARFEAEGVDPAGLGFEDEELARLLDFDTEGMNSGSQAGKSQSEGKTYHGSTWTLPEGPIPEVRLGETWRLGRHRLRCGDATDEATVASLLGDAGRPVLLTDPPYCSGSSQEAGKAAGTWGEIASDQLSTRGYEALLSRALAAARPVAAYVFTDWRMWNTLFGLVESGGLPVRSMLIWNKGPGLGGIWRPSHELILFAARERSPRIKGQPAESNVLNINKIRNRWHYTEKPVELLKRILENDSRASTRSAAAVLDPFAGSGTTAIAAEAAGRTVYMLEIEPRFCGLALRRWAETTGEEPVRDG